MRHVCVLVVGWMLLGLSACNTSTPGARTPQAETAESTADPTTTETGPEVTPTATRRPVRTSVSSLPAVTPTLACANAPRTRLIINERGRVQADDPRPLNVRAGPGTEFEVLGRLEPLDIFAVLDGPLCGGSFAWYLIQFGALRGWIAEGDASVYYVEPYLPG